MPQGGIDDNKNHIDAGYRELEEETTITKEQTEFIDFWDEFQKYNVPEGMYKRDGKVYKGQKQKWLILRYIEDEKIHLEQAQDHEFKEYKWVSMDEAVELVWFPKKKIYENLAKKYSKLF
ncbi:MAG: NUDIX domain-containing protein [Proteobacteria bacterium]|nr:NUDIX domain-containing protein [Pseudomonadota bacterium]